MMWSPSFHPKARRHLCLNVKGVFSHTFDISTHTEDLCLRMMVLTVLALWQEPESILPLIETVPVNEHF